MKKLLMIAIIAISVKVSFGQMDEKFYFPDKEWISISEDYTPLVMVCDLDTVYTAIFKPKSTPKQQSYSSTAMAEISQNG